MKTKTLSSDWTEKTVSKLHEGAQVSHIRLSDSDSDEESDKEYIDYKIENLTLFLKEIRLLKNQ